eukprot:3064243-Lingulodinium_polyedra.AAC.1
MPSGGQGQRHECWCHERSHAQDAERAAVASVHGRRCRSGEPRMAGGPGRACGRTPRTYSAARDHDGVVP